MSWRAFKIASLALGAISMAGCTTIDGKFGLRVAGEAELNVVSDYISVNGTFVEPDTTMRISQGNVSVAFQGEIELRRSIEHEPIENNVGCALFFPLCHIEGVARAVNRYESVRTTCEGTLEFDAIAGETYQVVIVAAVDQMPKLAVQVDSPPRIYREDALACAA